MKTRFDELPKWVQERMFECQAEQGNERDPEPFRKRIKITKRSGGFNWVKTKEGFTNWRNAVDNLNYNGINKPKKFVIPEEWYLKPKNIEEAKILSKYYLNLCGLKESSFIYTPEKVLELGITAPDFGYSKSKEATEITFKQFEKYILKQDNMEKEIVGYKLVRPEYNSAVIDITKINNTCWEGFKKGWFKKDHPNCRNYKVILQRLKDANVLDDWFEPIYEEENKLSVINGYEGKEQEFYQPNKDGSTSSVQGLKYGCAELDQRWFKSFGNRYIKSMVLSSGVEINEEQMDQIRKYLEKLKSF